MVDVLFIGGPHDGKMQPVDNLIIGSGVIETLNFPLVPVGPVDLLPESEESVSVIRYRIMKIDMHVERRFVAVAPSIRNPLDHLLKGYQTS